MCGMRVGSIAVWRRVGSPAGDAIFGRDLWHIVYQGRIAGGCKARVGGLWGEVGQVERSDGFLGNAENGSDGRAKEQQTREDQTPRRRELSAYLSNGLFVLCCVVLFCLFIHAYALETVPNKIPQPHRSRGGGSPSSRRYPPVPMHAITAPFCISAQEEFGVDLRHGSASHQIGVGNGRWGSGQHNRGDDERHHPSNRVEAGDHDRGSMQWMLRGRLGAVDGLPLAR